MKVARALLVMVLLSSLAAASAHAFLVLGEMSVEPDPPQPGAPLRIVVDMSDPSLAPVEDAVVSLELRRERLVGIEVPAASTEAPELPPPDAVVELVERAPGRYEGELLAPAAGTHHVLIRDQTFQWEEANASLMIDIGDGALGTVPFILPPTAIGPRSLWTWLLWLVGLPIAAGLVVTLLVLGGRRGEQPSSGQEVGPHGRVQRSPSGE